MALLRAEITDFRCLRRLELEFDPRFTLISGANASGKTSLLEALFVLGRGRSFRTRQLEHLVRHGAQRFVVFGDARCAEQHLSLGVEGSVDGTRAQIGGGAVQSLAELAMALPVQVIDPEVHKLIEEGPSRRRRFMDWGVFHVERGFVDHWQRYQKALRQRNAALKLGQARATVQAWDGELVAHGEAVAVARENYVSGLREGVALYGRQLLGLDLELAVRQGWQQGTLLCESLEARWALDCERRVTQAGPHRADLAIKLDGRPVRDLISRGQQKLVAAALLLAQLRYFGADSASPAVLLLDDPAAELDRNHLDLLIAAVRELPVQLVVTSLDPSSKAFGSPGVHHALGKLN
jgi:DNA replication and repair protein RecF